MKNLFVLGALLFVVLIQPINAQVYTFNDEVPEYFLKRYLSEEEMHIPITHQRDAATVAPQGPVRMVAEFEPLQAILIRYPLGLPYAFIAAMSQEIEVITIVSSNNQANTVLNLYNQNGVNTANCSFLVAGSNTYWTRDYGPWFVFDGNNQPGVTDFTYNRPRPNDNAVPQHTSNLLGINYFHMNVTHCGGNLMVDGLYTGASTDLVYEENTSLGIPLVNQRMADYLGVTDYDVTMDPLGDYIKHIDTWGKYLAPDKILIGQVPQSDPRYSDFEMVANYFANRITPWGYPYKVYRVFTPGGSPSTPYTNSLIANNRVFVPTTGSIHDAQALAVYQQAMPGYEIVPVQWSGWLNTDALHCRTREIADIGMLYIDHRPQFGLLEWQEEIAVSADIIAYSGSDLYADSLFVYYSINSGEYQQAPLSFGDEAFSGFISGFEGGDTIRYFLYAADASGRRVKHPYMGQHDPHWFVMGEQAFTDLVVSPDTLFFITDLRDKFGIGNPTPNTVMIETIENITADAVAQLVDLPELPFELHAGETLEVTVEVVLPVTSSTFDEDYYVEIVAIATGLGEKEVVLMISKDLITGLNPAAFASQLKVYPNPFSRQLAFELELDRDEHVQLLLFDMHGRKVAKVQDGQLQQGKHSLVWAENNNEVIVPGIYFYELRLSNEIIRGKLVRN